MLCVQVNQINLPPICQTTLEYVCSYPTKTETICIGADPSPAQFNIMMHGNEPEKLDGTQLAADWTFSGLQKFGQSFLDRLRGQKLPNRLLEKVLQCIGNQNLLYLQNRRAIQNQPCLDNRTKGH